MHHLDVDMQYLQPKGHIKVCPQPLSRKPRQTAAPASAEAKNKQNIIFAVNPDKSCMAILVSQIGIFFP